jgi:hypothetical protein
VTSGLAKRSVSSCHSPTEFCMPWPRDILLLQPPPKKKCGQ